MLSPNKGLVDTMVTPSEFQRGGYWRIGVPIIHSLDGTENHTPLELLGTTTTGCSDPLEVAEKPEI